MDRPVELPIDEITEQEERTIRHDMMDMALRQARLADKRCQEDMETGETRGAHWESRLCLKWFREWRTMAE
ncbi:MAG: hypothetical protein ABJA67_03110 [Chthonomonadales bacterium]